MSYSDSQTFTLEELGAPELWVTYSRPGLLPYKEGQEFMKLYKNFNTKRMDMDGSQTMAEFLNDTEAEFEWVLSLIEAWNIEYTSRHEKAGQVIPIPSSEEGIWKEIPGLYMSFIVAMIKKDPTGSDFLAKGMMSSISTSTPSLMGDRQTENVSNG